MGTALVMHGVQRASQDQGPARAPKDKRRRALWFEYLKPIPLHWSLTLGVAVWVIFFGLWELAAAKGWVNTLFMPPPHQVVSTLYTMTVAGELRKIRLDRDVAVIGTSHLPNSAGMLVRVLAADGAALKLALHQSWCAARLALKGSLPVERRK